MGLKPSLRARPAPLAACPHSTIPTPHRRPLPLPPPLPLQRAWLAWCW